MKHWVLVAAVLALLVPAAASAADDPHHGGHPAGGGHPQVHQGGGGRSQGVGNSQFGHGGPGGGQHFAPNHGGGFNRPQVNHNQFNHNQVDHDQTGRGLATFNRGGGTAQHNFDRGPNNAIAGRGNRPGVNRPAFNGARNAGRNFGNNGGHSFQYRGHTYAAVHLGAFNYPHGWGYRHWAAGNYLPLFFLSSAYFFDYGTVGLPPPPPGTYWVRYGPDALLVDRYSGRIVNVVYGVFY